MSHLLTLGYTPNPLIEKYQDAFVSKLQNLWISRVWGDLPPRDFLLYPDIHGLLLASARPWILEAGEYKKILLDEYQKLGTPESIFTKDTKKLILWTPLELTLRFHNPDIEKHTHPDHQKNQIGTTFGTKSEKEWQALFATSFDIVRKVSPEFMSEIDRIIQKIIPFDVSYQVHNSWSYSNVIWHLLMSYPTGMDYPELALLEAILHEYNHNKLNLIMQTETLILNDRREIYYSPYRPDARHIYGIYLGLHAIVWAYWVIWNAYTSWIITLTDIWQEKAVLYVLKNGLSLQVLDKYALLSPLGKEILEEMRAVHRECLDFIKQSQISPEIITRARSALMTHYGDVRSNYPWLLV